MSHHMKSIHSILHLWSTESGMFNIHIISHNFHPFSQICNFLAIISDSIAFKLTPEHAKFEFTTFCKTQPNYDTLRPVSNAAFLRG